MKLLLQFVRYIEACMTSTDRLDKFHSFFSASFLLAKEKWKLLVKLLVFQPLVQSFFSPELVGCSVEIIRNDQRQNIVSTHSIVVTPLIVAIWMKGFEKYSQMQRIQDSSPGRIQAAPLSWLNLQHRIHHEKLQR